MARKNDPDQLAIEGALNPEQKQALIELMDDYKAACVLVGYTGGLAGKIAVALIADGWRKRPN